MNDLACILIFERSTKNKHLYKAKEGMDDVLGSVYIEKSAMPAEPPEQITITIHDSSD